jgi:hypothetical protein
MTNYQPVGQKFSINHHHVVLMNWARRTKTKIGSSYHEGWSISVDGDSESAFFVVKHLGEGFHPFSKKYRFDANEREKHRSKSRLWAFKNALELFRKVSK